MLFHVRLHEHDALLGIETSGVQTHRHVHGQLGEIGRFVRLRDRVQVDNAEQTVVLRLQPDPVLHGAEVVADVQLAGRLDTAEHTFL